MADMDEKPKRRRFRFRISTVLILIAILAWGWRVGRVLTTERMAHDGFRVDDPLPPDYWYSDDKPPRRPRKVYRVNRQLGWPLLAPITFIIGKAAWDEVK